MDDMGDGPSRGCLLGAAICCFFLGRRDRGRRPVAGVAVMGAHLLAGLLLGLAFVCFVIPALVALSGPDHDSHGRVSPGWMRRDREGRQ